MTANDQATTAAATAPSGAPAQTQPPPTVIDTPPNHGPVTDLKRTDIDQSQDIFQMALGAVEAGVPAIAGPNSSRSLLLTTNDVVGGSWDRGETAARDVTNVWVVRSPNPGSHPPFVVAPVVRTWRTEVRPVTQIAATSWSRSLRALFGEDVFAAVGARRRDDWRLDALDVMHLRTDDPRGWSKVAVAAGGGDYGTGPDSPFSAVTPGDFSAAFPVSRRGAEQILVTLQSEWFQTEDIPDFDAREAELTSHARTILERFGEDALFFTNAATARENPHADMFRREGAYEGFTSHVMDCGVITVSATEVGIFWGFTID